MSRFANSGFNLKSLADNSYKAIEEGAYDAQNYDFTKHDSISMKRAILSCSHAPIITEIKFASPSKGQIIAQTEMDSIQLAFNIDLIRLYWSFNFDTTTFIQWLH